MEIELASRRYRHVSEAVFRRPWAILPEKLSAIGELVAMRLDGFRMDPAAVASIAAAAKAPPNRSQGLTAVLPLYGTLMWRCGPLEEISGATSMSQFGRAFDAALADERIKSIVIDVDSPGGTVDGTMETAAKILAARGTKPITAVVNTLAASAALWIATAADEVVITPSGMAGSVGVYMLHVDESQADEAEGLRFTFIEAPAGGFKTEGNRYSPLSEEAAAHYQGIVDELYGEFVDGVARARGVTATKVREEFGKGRVFTAKEAVKRGMADRIATLEAVLERHGGASNAVAVGSRAEDEGPTPVAGADDFFAYMDAVGTAQTREEDAA